MLTGSEVKAIRAGRVNIKDSFVKIVKGEAFVFNMHISHLDTTTLFVPDTRRDRKLLLHKKEIIKIDAKASREGLAIVPTVMYLSHKNLVKLKIALAKGKKNYDKRESLKAKDQKRSIARALKDY